MTDHFEQLRRAAFQRGMDAYESGVPREDNPHRNVHATDEAEHWDLGWDNARELAKEA